MNEVKSLTWYEWIQSDSAEAEQYRGRISSGCANPENPAIAAHLAYDAGVKAGIILAAERLYSVMRRA